MTNDRASPFPVSLLDSADVACRDILDAFPASQEPLSAPSFSTHMISEAVPSVGCAPAPTHSTAASQALPTKCPSISVLRPPSRKEGTTLCHPSPQADLLSSWACDAERLQPQNTNPSPEESFWLKEAPRLYFFANPVPSVGESSLPRQPSI